MPKKPNRTLSNEPVPLDGVRLARALREHRESMGLSLRGLAKQAGVALATVQKLERGDMVVQLDIVLKVVSVLHIDFSELLAGSVTPPAKPTIGDLVREAAEKDEIPALLSEVARYWRAKKPRQ